MARLQAGIAVAVALLAATAARADDTEIFVGNVAAAGLRPNVLLIVDTSGSMNALVQLPKAPYDPGRTYAGECRSDRLYFVAATGPGGPTETAPDCSEQQGIDLDSNTCAAAASAMGSAGIWTGSAAQWNENSATWTTLSEERDDASVECEADAGIHGETAGSNRRYAQDGDPANRWTTSAARQLNWASSTTYTFFGANWLNWLFGPLEPANMTRLQVVQNVVGSFASSVDGINLGLMRFNNSGTPDGSDLAEGGMVTNAVTDIADSRDAIIDRVNSYTAAGFTPLSETLYEAGQYYAGRSVDYGRDSRIDADTAFPSVPESRRPDDASTYRSPIEFQCQKNFAILLTDGEPTQDTTADSKITSLPGFSGLVGSDCDGDGDGRCLDDFAEYLYEGDISPLPGQQNVVTYAIGFGPDVAGSAFLDSTAARGGGRAFAATNVTELTNVLQQIVGEIIQSTGTFTAPTLSINAFNRTQTTNEFYVSLFRPSDRLRWSGNVKKYAVKNGQIVDAAGDSAVDPATGFFRDTAQSLWSPRIDGARVTAGGAVSRQPAPDERRLYTFFAGTGSSNLTADGNRIDASNTQLTSAVLGIAGPAPTREQVIDWVKGRDAPDVDGDGDTSESAPSMGDPLHARPAVVTYGGTTGAPDPLDTVVYTATNDGFLHAIDARTGRELWAFIPPELLGRLAALYANPAVASRSYGLDGDIRLLRFDANQDGVLEPLAGDRAILYFGMRRGGRFYYALDVTNRSSPTLLWTLGPSQLPGIGETWSQPTLGRVRVSGATQNGENLVLILGGGYDGAQENYSYVEDTSGNRLFIVDAISGALLWYAGGSGGAGSPDLELAQMQHSIPGRITAIDTNGDQYIDRLYAGDMGGRVWRFDIFNGNSRGSLVTGGVFAKLGNGGNGTTAAASNRRFYNAPDVALIQRRGADSYYNIAVGSGYRGHPLESATQDRFYALRDRNPFGKLTQTEYSNLTPITDGALVDITESAEGATVPAGAPGWRLELRRNGGWIGEKVLADAVTISGTVLFTTYQPEAPALANPCLPSAGRNRVYALRVDTGAPALDLDDNQRIDGDDASQLLNTRGIAGEVTLVVESTLANRERDPDADELGRRMFCAVGVEVLNKCVRPGGVVRTFWERGSTDRKE